MTAADTFANEWTNAEAWIARTAPELDRLTDMPRAERVRLMAVARTVTELAEAGGRARITLGDATGMRAVLTGTVTGRTLLAALDQGARWLVTLTDANGQAWSLPEDQVLDIADA